MMWSHLPQIPIAGPVLRQSNQNLAKTLKKTMIIAHYKSISNDCYIWFKTVSKRFALNFAPLLADSHNFATKLYKTPQLTSQFWGKTPHFKQSENNTQRAWLTRCYCFYAFDLVCWPKAVSVRGDAVGREYDRRGAFFLKYEARKPKESVPEDVKTENIHSSISLPADISWMFCSTGCWKSNLLSLQWVHIRSPPHFHTFQIQVGTLLQLLLLPSPASAATLGGLPDLRAQSINFCRASRC